MENINYFIIYKDLTVSASDILIPKDMINSIGIIECEKAVDTILVDGNSSKRVNVNLWKYYISNNKIVLNDFFSITEIHEKVDCNKTRELNRQITIYVKDQFGAKTGFAFNKEYNKPISTFDIRHNLERITKTIGDKNSYFEIEEYKSHFKSKDEFMKKMAIKLENLENEVEELKTKIKSED